MNDKTSRIIEIVMIVAALILISAFIRNAFSLQTDETDKNGWERSGLQLHTDYGTGIQYLSDGNGGLIQRIKP